MNKGLGFLIVGLLAIIGGAAFAALIIKNKLTKEKEIDFDDFDTAVDDEEFEHFFGSDDDDYDSEYGGSDIDVDDFDDDKDEQL